MALPEEIPIPEWLRETIEDPHHLFHATMKALHHRYNATFRMASVSTNRVENTGGRSYLYRSNGAIYHCMRQIEAENMSRN